VRATYSGDHNYVGSSVLGGGDHGSFSVLGNVTTPTTGAGLLAWQLLLGLAFLIAGLTATAIARARARTARTAAAQRPSPTRA
jgi:amino acid transporter